MPFDSLVHKTTLDENTSPPLYPVLENSDSVDRNSNLSHHREKFVENWKNLIDLEHQIEVEKAKKYQTTSTTGNIEQLETQKKEASLVTQNLLHLYIYQSLQSTLSASDGITAEVIENCTDTLKKEIAAQGIDIGKFNDLIRLKNTVHGNEKEFLFSIIEVLKKEIQKIVEGDKKKSKSSKYTLSSSLEKLQEKNETLKNSLEKAQNRITELERNLQTTLATEQQLQSLLKKKEETNVVIETEGQENIAKLEGEKIELLNNTVVYLQQENQKLSNKINMGVTHDEDSTTSAPQQWGATMENKLSKLKQKPEENCRAFVSRLNNLHDTIEGKEEKSDHNQTIVEGQLLNKLRKVRDKRKKKVLLRGLLPKYKRELFLRMPDDPEDFDALCKQLFLSEKILHTKEETEDDDMSAVIAGITKHQDEKLQLLEQKLTESLTELKLSNTKCGSSQDKLTIAAVDQNDRRR
ncbi:hypothetical protein GHT06_021606 [Daphnia sinensis]|uniref:Uncharacterized protein n=1 Tax=Daphnia sinensis TaxID=1820382 RepID=A0AAD5PQ15_9CRUS|nr:hypothetical protein GHT06_021606 [Daphnia sinensis]